MYLRFFMRDVMTAIKECFPAPRAPTQITEKSTNWGDRMQQHFLKYGRLIKLPKLS